MGRAWAGVMQITKKIRWVWKKKKNRRCGDVCAIVIVVGRQGVTLRRGVDDEHFPRRRWVIVAIGGRGDEL